MEISSLRPLNLLLSHSTSSPVQPVEPLRPSAAPTKPHLERQESQEHVTNVGTALWALAVTFSPNCSKGLPRDQERGWGPLRGPDPGNPSNPSSWPRPPARPALTCGRQ